jgi:hypothetical protein
MMLIWEIFLLDHKKEIFVVDMKKYHLYQIQLNTLETIIYIMIKPKYGISTEWYSENLLKIRKHTLRI